MQDFLKVNIGDLLNADVLVKRDEYLYALWYNPDKKRLIVLKKKEIEEIKLYQSIDEYIEKGMEEIRKEILEDEVLSYEIEKFLRKYENDSFGEEIETEKIKELKKEEDLEKKIIIKDEKNEEKRKIAKKEKIRQEKIFSKIKERILKLRRTPEDLIYTEEMLYRVQSKMKAKEKFTFKEVDTYAKSIVQKFWNGKIPEDNEEITILLLKILYIDFNRT